MTVKKALIALAVSAAGAFAVALGTGSDAGLNDLDAVHWLTAGLAVLGSGGMVWWTENGPWHTYIKTVSAFLSGGIASLVVALNDNHVTQAELLVAFTAAVAATGLVFQASNAPRSTA
jgi:peptidoglycan/LPS O-acetylase OafA/YrhL